MQALPLPRWVNVVLEGGGVVLERACADSARLLRLLGGDWRTTSAADVAVLARELAARQLEVEATAARALHRAGIEPRFDAAVTLAAEVGRRRDALAQKLGCAPGQLCVALGALAAEADEAVWVARAWRNFAFERRAWLVGLLGASSAAPLASWAIARELGGVKLDFAGLVESGSTVGLLFVTAVTAFAAQQRVISWEWLRGDRGGLRLHAPLGGIVLATVLAALALRTSPSALGAALFAGTAALVVRAVWTWWR